MTSESAMTGRRKKKTTGEDREDQTTGEERRKPVEKKRKPRLGSKARVLSRVLVSEKILG